MFSFGDRVVILNENLKTHEKTGLFVGYDSKGKAKVYLEEPIKNGKTVCACVSINKDFVHYCGKNEMTARLTALEAKHAKLEAELKEVEAEIFTLEYKMMMGAD